MDRMSPDNSDLVKAFPESVREDAVLLTSALPKPRLTADTFSVFVGNELLQIPSRVYHEVGRIDSALLTGVQSELLDCLLTRHHDGHVREAHLRKILGRKHEWIPPFVVQLVGEYVIEILSAIRDGLHELDHDLYRAFLISNPAFFKLTKQRVASYRNCYYPCVRVGDYVGFEIVRFFDSLIGANH